MVGGSTISKLISIVAGTYLLGAYAMAADGLTTIASDYGPKETMDRLEAEIKAKGMTVFARVDHAAGLGRYHRPARAHSHRGHFRPERLRQIDGPRRIRRGSGGARAARRPGAGAGADRGERRIFRRSRHRLWVDDALRRTADDRFRDRRDADLASLLGASGGGAPHPERPLCQERGDYRRLLIPLRHRRRPLQPGSLAAQQQIARYSLLPPSCLSLANTASTLSSAARFFSSRP